MALGIDFGTSHSVMAYYKNGVAEIIPNREGSRLTPSLVDPDSFSVGGGGIGSIKRLLGRSINDKPMIPHDLQEESDGSLGVVWKGKSYAPEEIAATILAKMRFDAEHYLGEKIDEAVITVPAYYDNTQRQATKTAAEIAGIRVLRLLNEPTAAALAYGLDKGEETLLVVDLGGGTFDVSLLEVNNGFFEVLATHGDTSLGGDDFTKVLASLFDFSMNNDAEFLRHLEETKHDLSSMQKAKVYFLSSSGNSIERTITREEFEKVSRPLLERLLLPIERVLSASSVKKEDITKLLFVGGATRMPAVRKEIEEFLDMRAVSGVNPEEVVAIGAALQGGIIKGAEDDILLLDVLPLSFGVETHDGRMSVLLPSNTTIPVQETEIFTTAEDNQASVEVNILQGESLLAEGNKHLGQLRLLGIPPTIAGVPQIEVNFSFDADGILHVTAKDLATGREQKTSLIETTAIEEEEVLRLKEEARSKRDLELDISLKRSQRAKAERILSAGRKLFQKDGLLNDTYIHLQKALNNLEEEIEADDIKSIVEVEESIISAEEELRRLYSGSDQAE